MTQPNDPLSDPDLGPAHTPPPSNFPPATAPPPPVPYETPGSATGYPGAYFGPPPDQNAKTMGMLCHLLSLAGILIPFGNLIGPIIIWQVKKKDHPFIDDQGKESVNFQILMTIALIVCIALICVAVGFFLLPVVGIVGLVFSIIACIKANNGEAYRYPFNIRFIK